MQNLNIVKLKILQNLNYECTTQILKNACYMKHEGNGEII